MLQIPFPALLPPIADHISPRNGKNVRDILILLTSSDKRQAHDKRRLVLLKETVDFFEFEETHQVAHFPELPNIVPGVVENLEKFQHSTPHREPDVCAVTLVAQVGAQHVLESYYL